MAKRTHFTADVVEAVGRAKIVGVRSGDQHRHTGVWVVVVDGRVFVRSWNDMPAGWYRAFRGEPRGSLQVGSGEIAVRAIDTRSARLRKAVTDAYAKKYDTKASQKWVTGFAEPERERTTLELVPA
jgi:hypothetical protein